MSSARLKKMTFLLGWFAAIGVLIMLLLSNLAAYIPADSYWIVAMAGLFFPIAFLFNLVGLVITAFKRHHLSWAFLLLCLSSIPNIIKSVAFNTSNNLDIASSPSLTLMSWNVKIMNFSSPDSTTTIRENKTILNEIKNSGADVVCLQEFFSAILPGNYYNMLDSISHTMGYPYYLFSRDHPYFQGAYFSGSVIFSKYPIIDTARIAFSEQNIGAIIKATILKENQPIDVITSRFQSVYLNKYDYATIGMNREDQTKFSGFRTILKKLKYGFQQRSLQINLLDSIIKSSSNALLVCVDLNDTPTSYSYNTISSSLTDIWQKVGSGMGRTFKFFSPTLRIDYIFCNQYFEPVTIKRISTSGSDHLALIAELRTKKEAR